MIGQRHLRGCGQRRPLRPVRVGSAKLRVRATTLVNQMFSLTWPPQLKQGEINIMEIKHSVAL